MQPLRMMAIAAATAAFCGAALSQTSTPTPTPGSDAAQPAPAPIVIQTNVDLRTDPGPPADLHAVREEAVNALQWAKTEGCRDDPAPRECIARAQAEYKRVMAELAGRGR